ncbi:cell wall protein PRY3-like [Zerene cesonia]|uniref:cell wall protein PRY3-like n=1 Tax=Zerene cesonia TaxID=33412 RepID=UPI0018E530DA|nr:cell wall protein PRY3-like [Zerene cesonia]
MNTNVIEDGHDSQGHYLCECSWAVVIAYHQVNQPVQSHGERHDASRDVKHERQSACDDVIADVSTSDERRARASTRDGPAPNCLKYERIIKSDKDKQDIVNKINSRRNKVASGDIRSLPPASNMMKVKWNEELEKSAQRWADQCEGGLDLEDTCRNLENIPVGQNIATLYGEVTDVKPSTMVDLWYMQLLHINPAIIAKYQPSSTRRFHRHDYFTQLVWSETTDVGCGAVKFQERFPETFNKSRTVFRLVCNFMPCGNIEGQRVYNQGPPCSSCGLNINCDSNHKYLCEQKIEVVKTRPNAEEMNYSIVLNNTQLNKLENAPNAKNNSLAEATESVTGVDSDITLDLFSFLININENTTTPHTEITRLCKDVLFVDEFMDILRKKLSTDTLLKDMLMTTKTAQSDKQYSDAKIDAIVSKIYGQKTTPTSTKTTMSESINSTLLVDLVEAVIFRSRDKISKGEDTSSVLDASIEARTVQMQAELAETRQNQEFTGHYFFPEEEEREENIKEQTEPYYDSSIVPISEIELEIEELKRNRGTKDFLDDILETDLYTESQERNHFITFDDNKGT